MNAARCERFRPQRGERSQLLCSQTRRGQRRSQLRRSHSVRASDSTVLQCQIANQVVRGCSGWCQNEHLAGMGDLLNPVLGNLEA